MENLLVFRVFTQFARSNENGNMRAGFIFTVYYIFGLLDVASGFSVHASVTSTKNREVFFRKTSVHRTDIRTSTGVLSSSNDNDGEDNSREKDIENQSDVDKQENDLSWLKNAMSKDIPSELLSTESYSSSPKLPKFESGLAGFAVDPELGFVSILLGEDPRPEKFTFAVMSPTDINNVSSAEALCLVQLAGGLDLGAAVLPPEALARIVSEALEESEEDSEMLPFDSVEALRSRVSLLGVIAKTNERYTPNDSQESAKSKEYKQTNRTTDVTSSVVRDEAIRVSAPKILSAVKNLPGLGKVTLSDILEALKLHSDPDGNLNRDEFSQVLGTLRHQLSRTMIKDQRVKFQLTVSISSDSNAYKDDVSELKLLNIDDVPAFLAVALSLRYKVKISVLDDCLPQQDNDQNVMDRFPAFKPIQELVKDAQSISGSISSMFFKQSAPNNDDKS
jgi:hypothetical protein